MEEPSNPFVFPALYYFTSTWCFSRSKNFSISQKNNYSRRMYLVWLICHSKTGGILWKNLTLLMIQQGLLVRYILCRYLIWLHSSFEPSQFPSVLLEFISTKWKSLASKDKTDIVQTFQDKNCIPTTGISCCSKNFWMFLQIRNTDWRNPEKPILEIQKLPLLLRISRTWKRNLLEKFHTNSWKNWV